jgi:hypothetical protein
MLVTSLCLNAGFVQVRQPSSCVSTALKVAHSCARAAWIYSTRKLQDFGTASKTLTTQLKDLCHVLKATCLLGRCALRSVRRAKRGCYSTEGGKICRCHPLSSFLAWLARLLSMSSQLNATTAKTFLVDRRPKIGVFLVGAAFGSRRTFSMSYVTTPQQANTAFRRRPRH